jgi:hypothetical protein
MNSETEIRPSISDLAKGYAEILILRKRLSEAESNRQKIQFSSPRMLVETKHALPTRGNLYRLG